MGFTGLKGIDNRASTVGGPHFSIFGIWELSGNSRRGEDAAAACFFRPKAWRSGPAARLDSKRGNFHVATAGAIQAALNMDADPRFSTRAKNW